MYKIDYKVNELAYLSLKKAYYNYYHEKWKSSPKTTMARS